MSPYDHAATCARFQIAQAIGRGKVTPICFPCSRTVPPALSCKAKPNDWRDQQPFYPGRSHMAHCEGFDTCRYFKEYMANMPSTAAMTQANYCKNNFSECARYRVFKALGESAVPADLSPSESNRADKILAATSKP